MTMSIRFIFVSNKNNVFKNNAVFKKKTSLKRITFDIRTRIDKSEARSRSISKRSLSRKFSKTRRISSSSEHLEVQIENSNDLDDFIDIDDDHDDDDDDAIFVHNSSSTRRSRARIQQSTTTQNQTLDDLNAHKNNLRHQLKIQKNIRKLQKELKILKRHQSFAQRTLISFSQFSKLYLFVAFSVSASNLYLFAPSVSISQNFYLNHSNSFVDFLNF